VRKKPVDYVLPWMQFPARVASDWVDATTASTDEGGVLPENWEQRGSFLYHSLAAEATEITMRRIALLRSLSRDLGKGKKILVYGAGVGTYMYPWAEHEHDITAVAREGAWTTTAFKRRMRQDFITHSLREVGASWFESGLRSRYDVVLCLDLLGRLEQPIALAEHLSGMADTLILSANFAPSADQPWLRTSQQHSLASLADRLTGNGARSGRRSLDPSCDWSSDILIFR
jgi:hypothetical protein